MERSRADVGGQESERGNERVSGQGSGQDRHDGQPDGARAEIVRLKARHSEIERRLLELERHLSLTSDEQLERAQLKKEKLRSKDRITFLAQQTKAA